MLVQEAIPILNSVWQGRDGAGRPWANKTSLFRAVSPRIRPKSGRDEREITLSGNGKTFSRPCRPCAWFQNWRC
ncbi:MAG TPA: hypothetical protein EYH05_07440 [Anaerolineae bacterium]|nr:hypothetical protein [Anaerolineae bacterium]